MKRVIKASTFNSDLKNYSTYIRNRQKFSIHSNDPKDPNDWKATISEIHPYDLAEYTWARVGSRGSGEIEFFRDGKLIDRMQLHYYDPEDYESKEEYIDEIIDQICLELRHFNEDVEPRIDHT